MALNHYPPGITDANFDELAYGYTYLKEQRCQECGVVMPDHCEWNCDECEELLESELKWIDEYDASLDIEDEDMTLDKFIGWYQIHGDEE